jgi:hypothetical protein
MSVPGEITDIITALRKYELWNTTIALMDAET